MALSDILEALTLGGAGAVRGYVSAKQEEEARAERERQREEDRKYREATLALQQRQFDAAEAARQRQDVRETQRDISEGLLRETRELPNMAAARGTISDALKAAERSAGADLFEDQGIGMAAKPAAGQTNAAQFLREQEARGKGPSRMQTPMSFLDEVPEFTPSESFRELGTQEFRGAGLRPVTPEERRAIALEEEERKRLAMIEDEAREYALNQKRADQAVADARARGITDPYALEDIRAQIATGTRVSRPPEPRATGIGRTPMEDVINEVVDFASRPQGLLGTLPDAKQVQDRLLFLSALYGLDPDESGELAARVARASQPIRPPALP